MSFNQHRILRKMCCDFGFFFILQERSKISTNLVTIKNSDHLNGLIFSLSQLEEGDVIEISYNILC